jgi:isoleucyl-tRNA synthetase
VTCKKYGMVNDDILTPVQSNGVYVPSLEFFGGQFIWKANPAIVDKLSEVGALMHTTTSAQLHALLAPQDPADLPRHRAVVRRHGQAADQRRHPAQRALKAIEDTKFVPAWGQALHSMIANRPDWCISASATGACRSRSS